MNVLFVFFPIVSLTFKAASNYSYPRYAIAKNRHFISHQPYGLAKLLIYNLAFTYFLNFNDKISPNSNYNKRICQTGQEKYKREYLIKSLGLSNF